MSRVSTIATESRWYSLLGRPKLGEQRNLVARAQTGSPEHGSSEWPPCRYPWARHVKVKQKGNENVPPRISLQNVEERKYKPPSLKNHPACLRLTQEDMCKPV